MSATSKELTNKGIVVLGSPRSGTTLLRRLLNAHPRIACPGETCTLSASARFLQSETVADGLEFGVMNGLSFAGFSEEAVLSRLRDFVFGFHEEHAASQGKARWAEKTAVDVFHLEQIEELCADQVQYVCIVRHGLDVACSLKDFSDRGFTYLTEIHHYVKKYPRVLEAFCHAWVDANEAIMQLQSRRPEQVVVLRYEDLVESPETQLPVIFDFLGESLPDDLVDVAMQGQRTGGLGDWKTYSKKALDKASISRWGALPPNVIGRLGEICNPTLTAFGYEAIAASKKETQKQARRRYEFSLAFGANKKGSEND